MLGEQREKRKKESQHVQNPEAGFQELREGGTRGD